MINIPKEDKKQLKKETAKLFFNKDYFEEIFSLPWGITNKNKSKSAYWSLLLLFTIEKVVAHAEPIAVIVALLYLFPCY